MKKDFELTNLLVNCDFTNDQKKILNMFLENLEENFLNKKMFVFSGKAGCVDMNTEFFTGNSWKKISDYTEGDKVLQYNEDGTAELVEPIEYHKYPAENLTLMKTKYGVNQCLSDEHSVVYKTSKGNLNKKDFKEMKDMHNKSLSGFSGRFYTTFIPKINGKLNLSDNEIRLMVAILADGSRYNSSQKFKLNLKKKSKKDRLRKLLKNCNIEFKEYSWNSNDLEYISFIFTPPVKIEEKRFTEDWYNCDIKQLQIIKDEILYWDGCFDGRDNKTSIGRFFTTIKTDADFIQYVFTCLGYRAKISVSNRIGKSYKDSKYIRKSLEYIVSVTKRSTVCIGGHTNIKTKNKIFSNYKTIDGFKYCFTVPSGMLVLRRGGNINITGNSGKSFALSIMIKMCEHYSKSLLVGTFTGKASQVLREKGVESNTLHSIMYKPITDINGKIVGWDKNRDIPCDILFVDEHSMLSEELINDILSYNKITIFLGDNKQLPPVGQDSLYLEDKTDIELNEIVRQAEGNPVIKYANDVREGKSLKIGIKEKTDEGLFATLDFKKNKNTIDKLKQSYDQIICGTNKTRHFLNNEYRKNRGYSKILHEEESVIVLRNDKTHEVFNGQILKVISIKEEKIKDEIGLIVQNIMTDQGEYPICINGLYEPDFNFNNYLWDNRFSMPKNYIPPVFVNFSYALTCHKLQGSSADKILIFAKDLNFMKYMSDSKDKGEEMYNRALYTAITRAVKNCVVVI